MLKEQLDIENVEIERAHRAGRKRRNKPRTIVCKLLLFKDKQDILRKAKLLKETNIFINEDYCQDTVEFSIVSRDKVPALSSETEIIEY